MHRAFERALGRARFFLSRVQRAIDILLIGRQLYDYIHPDKDAFR